MNPWILLTSFAVAGPPCLASSRPPAAPTTLTFLALSDVHFDHAAVTSTYGEDSGTLLWGNAQAKLRAVVAETHPRFILFLGDLPAHRTSDADRALNMRTVLQDLRQTVGPQLPVFFVPGNNDALGGNYHSFTDKNGMSALALDPGFGWPGLNTAACAGGADAPVKACRLSQPDGLKFGYYSAYPLGPANKLRLVALNSVIFSAGYVSDDGVAQDLAASEELAWLEGQLRDAESRGEAVVLAMHIPPGNDSYAGKPMWGKVFPGKAAALDQFLSLVDRYQNSLRIVLSSHTHFEELRLLTTSRGAFVTLGVSVPSVAPVHNNNAALKVFTVDSATFAPMDAKTYYTTPASRQWGDLTYSFKADYACAPADTMFACVASKPRNVLEAAMNAEYTVHYAGHTPNWAKVDGAITVSGSPP